MRHNAALVREGSDLNMFRNSTQTLLNFSLPVRLVWSAIGFIFFSTTSIIGMSYFPWSSPDGPLYWSVWAGVALGLISSAPLRALVRRVRLRKIAARAFTDCGPERNALTSAAVLIGHGREVRALQLLAHSHAPAPKSPGETARRWLEAWAGARWLSRQTHFEALPGSVEDFPQIHALIFCHSPTRGPLRMNALAEELDSIGSVKLDAYARGYIALIDVCIQALDDKRNPFSSEAPELLALLTGRSHLLGMRERFGAWWSAMRPVYVRGGGALLAGTRLIQRTDFTGAAKLLDRFASDGMLSREADTLRRAARFLALFSLPQWHLRGEDIARYFEAGLYHQWAELGVFRYPTAELPEVVACCQRGRIFRDAKRRLIEDTLEAWAVFGDDLAEPLAYLLRKLLDERARHQSSRLEFWRLKWELRKKTYDNDIERLMTGIVLAHKLDLSGALKAFADAAKLDPSSSLPLVNSVGILLKMGRRDEARELIRHIQRVHPRDGQALLSLGRLLAINAGDPKDCEELFLKALNLLDPPTEALNCLGEVKYLAGHHDESQFYFEQARQLAPDQPGPKLGLARVFVEKQRFKEAIEVLKEVARDGPGDARDVAYYMLYRTHRESGEDGAALKYLEMLPTRFFNDPDTIDDIAMHLESEKLYAKAREFADYAMLLRAHGKGRVDDPDALGAA